MPAKEKQRIYLDNGATTKVDESAVEAMMPYFTERYGNASSVHYMGAEAKKALEESRKVIADALHASPVEIIFTSGGTESNNFALKSAAFTNRDKGNHIITTRIEHDCVLKTCGWLEKQGFDVTYLDVDAEGFVQPEELEKAITDKTILVSIIHGSNEIGTIQDMEALGKICRKHSVLFHTDACQSFTKTELDMQKQHLNLVTVNAHKLHGPKGVGALYIRKGTPLLAWEHGGGHERNLRSGTENIPGIVGFAAAVKLALEKPAVEKIAALRDRLIKGVLKIPGSRLNGPTGDKRLCFNADFSFKAVESEAIVGLLQEKGVFGSSGSACSSHVLEPSHVIMALGLTHEDANGSLRLTLSRYTTQEEIDYVIEVLPGVIKTLRQYSPLEFKKR